MDRVLVDLFRRLDNLGTSLGTKLSDAGAIVFRRRKERHAVEISFASGLTVTVEAESRERATAFIDQIAPKDGE